jgi:hypothetical protein
MENIVPIAELRNHVDRVLEEIRHGVHAQRQKGLIVDMPDEVQFDCEVIFEFQSLEIRRASVTEGGDSRTQDEISTESGETTRTGEQSQTSYQGHDQKTVENVEYGADG